MGTIWVGFGALLKLASGTVGQSMPCSKKLQYHGETLDMLDVELVELVALSLSF